MYIHVTITPSAKKEDLKELRSGHFEVSVKEPAERNLANKRLLEILADHFNNPEGGVKIINGHHSRKKLIRVGK